MPQPIWNVLETAKMTEEQNLRNTCRQLEQMYVEWGHRATTGGYLASQEWPAIGELGRYLVPGVKVYFVTTRKREIEVRNAQKQTMGKVRMLPGMAQQLYVLAGACI